MQYPLVIHNQVVGKNWRPSKEDQVERPEIHAKSYSLSAENFAMFEKGRHSNAGLTPGLPGIAIPEFDEFVPNSIVVNTVRVFTILTTIDPDQPTFLFDLNEIGTRWSLHPLILAYLIRARERLVYPHRQPFLLTFYQNRNIVPNMLTVDATGKVFSKEPLSLRDYYHVRLGLATDWRSIDRAALDELREDGELLSQIMMALDPSINLCQLSTGYVPRHCLEEALDILDRRLLVKGNRQIYQFTTVQSFFLDAHARNI
jgi:hypothetical protein